MVTVSYVACHNRIFNIRLVLCLIWNGHGVVRIFCSSKYRLCSVVKCFVGIVIGNSSFFILSKQNCEYQVIAHPTFVFRKCHLYCMFMQFALVHCLPSVKLKLIISNSVVLILLQFILDFPLYLRETDKLLHENC